MINRMTIRLGAFALALTAAPSIASACQGPQFESRLVAFYDAEQSEIPEGHVQFRVRLIERIVQNSSNAELIRLRVLTDEGDDISRGRSAIDRITMVKPTGTSCHHAAIPAAGDYFVVGRIAKNEDGGPVMINGAALFYPNFNSVSAMQLQLGEAQ